MDNRRQERLFTYAMTFGRREFVHGLELLIETSSAAKIFVYDFSESAKVLNPCCRNDQGKIRRHCRRCNLSHGGTPYWQHDHDTSLEDYLKEEMRQLADPLTLDLLVPLWIERVVEFSRTFDAMTLRELKQVPDSRAAEESVRFSEAMPF